MVIVVLIMILEMIVNGGVIVVRVKTMLIQVN